MEQQKRCYTTVSSRAGRGSRTKMRLVGKKPFICPTIRGKFTTWCRYAIAVRCERFTMASRGSGIEPLFAFSCFLFHRKFRATVVPDILAFVQEKRSRGESVD